MSLGKNSLYYNTYYEGGAMAKIEFLEGLLKAIEGKAGYKRMTEKLKKEIEKCKV